jgi:hypothetical protein
MWSRACRALTELASLLYRKAPEEARPKLLGIAKYLDKMAGTTVAAMALFRR